MFFIYLFIYFFPGTLSKAKIRIIGYGLVERWCPLLRPSMSGDSVSWEADGMMHPYLNNSEHGYHMASNLAKKKYQFFFFWSIKSKIKFS